MSREVLELAPIPPHSVESLQAEIQSDIEEMLRENGKEDLLKSGQISVDVAENMPLDSEVIRVTLTLLSGVALETFKQVILPWLKRKYEVRQQKSEGDDKSESKG